MCFFLEAFFCGFRVAGASRASGAFEVSLGFRFSGLGTVGCSLESPLCLYRGGTWGGGGGGLKEQPRLS